MIQHRIKFYAEFFLGKIPELAQEKIVIVRLGTPFVRAAIKIMEKQ